MTVQTRDTIETLRVAICDALDIEHERDDDRIVHDLYRDVRQTLIKAKASDDIDAIRDVLSRLLEGTRGEVIDEKYERGTDYRGAIKDGRLRIDTGGPVGWTRHTPTYKDTALYHSNAQIFEEDANAEIERSGYVQVPLGDTDSIRIAIQLIDEMESYPVLSDDLMNEKEREAEDEFIDRNMQSIVERVIMDTHDCRTFVAEEIAETIVDTDVYRNAMDAAIRWRALQYHGELFVGTGDLHNDGERVWSEFEDECHLDPYVGESEIRSEYPDYADKILSEIDEIGTVLLKFPEAALNYAEQRVRDWTS